MSIMKFQIMRESQGAASKAAPWPGAVRGPESSAWPGEYEWFLEVADLEGLVKLLEDSGGALGLFAPEGGEESPVIQIFDEEEEEA